MAKRGANGAKSARCWEKSGGRRRCRASLRPRSTAWTSSGWSCGARNWPDGSSGRRFRTNRRGGGAMGKVWIVTKGEYSDYRIEGVFSDEAKASRVAEMIQGDYDEYPLDDARVDAIPAGNKMHTVFLYRNQAP